MCSKGDLLTALEDYYLGLGWTPTPEQLFNNDKHGLSLIDGFVIAASVPQELAKELLDRYYENNRQIEQLLTRESAKGFFRDFDSEMTLSMSIHPLTLMARQYEILQILQG